MSAPRIEFLLPGLVRLACEERDLLAAGDWESALVVREQFDESFSILQHVIDRSRANIGPTQVAELHRIHKVNGENLAIYTELRRTSGVELGHLSKVTQLGGYAPVNPGSDRAPRYLDQSA